MKKKIKLRLGATGIGILGIATITALPISELIIGDMRREASLERRMESVGSTITLTVGQRYALPGAEQSSIAYNGISDSPDYFRMTSCLTEGSLSAMGFTEPTCQGNNYPISTELVEVSSLYTYRVQKVGPDRIVLQDMGPQ